MKMILSAFLSIAACAVILSGCSKRVDGCTDPTAVNYNPKANNYNGSCVARIRGCLDTSAYNYNPTANTVDTCISKVYGCMDPYSYNYNPAANISNGTCVYAIVFWTSMSGYLPIQVTINGQTKTVTAAYTSGTPDQNTPGCAVFALPPGTYTYTATLHSSTISGTAVASRGVNAYQF